MSPAQIKKSTEWLGSLANQLSEQTKEDIRDAKIRRTVVRNDLAFYQGDDRGVFILKKPIKKPKFQKKPKIKILNKFQKKAIKKNYFGYA